MMFSPDHALRLSSLLDCELCCESFYTSGPDYRKLITSLTCFSSQFHWFLAGRLFALFRCFGSVSESTSFLSFLVCYPMHSSASCRTKLGFLTRFGHFWLLCGFSRFCLFFDFLSDLSIFSHFSASLKIVEKRQKHR